VAGMEGVGRIKRVYLRRFLHLSVCTSSYLTVV
jgi:hypothetical protein